MSLSCNLTGEGENFVKISVEGYERPVADNFYDANWLTCGLEVSVRPFRGLFQVALGTYDFESFLQELTELNIGKSKEAKFQTLEDQLSLQLTVSSIGVISVKGVAATIDQGTKLDFTFETDLTFLERFISELKLIVKRFPVIKSSAGSCPD